MALPAPFQKVWIRAVLFADIGLIRRRDDRPARIGDGDTKESVGAAPRIGENLRGLPPELVCWNLPGRAIVDKLTEAGPASHQRNSFLLLVNVDLQECLAIRRGQGEALVDFVSHNAAGQRVPRPRLPPPPGGMARGRQTPLPA